MNTTENVKFEGTNATTYSGSRHEKFNSRVYNRIMAENLALLHIAPMLMAEWEKHIAMETELNLQAQKEETTKKLVEADNDCDRTISFILGTIKTAANSPVKAQRDAAEKAARITEPYRKTAQQAYDVELSQIGGLLTDARNPANAPLFTTLGLNDALIQLEEQKEAMDSLMQLRGENRDAAKLLENSRTVRPRTDANYRAATEQIYASQLVCTVPEDLAKIRTLITDINRIIADTKTAQAASTRAGGDLSVYGTTKAVVIVHLPQGQKYKITDIANTVIAEGISAGTRLELPAPVGIYTVTCNGEPWEKPITVKG